MTTTVTANMPAQVNLHAYCGDTFTQLYRFLDTDGPIDLTDLQIRAAVRSTLGISTPLTVTDLNDGTIQIAAAGWLAPDLYDYDIQITDTTGTTQTWVRGKLRMTQDITQ